MRVASGKNAKHGKKVVVASARKSAPSIGHFHSRDDSHAVRVASASAKRPH